MNPTLRRAQAGRALRVELLEARQLLAIDTWQNPVSPLDVNNDGHISAIDALVTINALNEHGPGDLFDIFGAPGNYYYDANGDGALTTLDPLVVINRLNAAAGGPKLQVGLASDTGASPTDRVTSDPTLAGKLTVPAGFETLTGFTGTLNGSALQIDLTPLLQVDGSFAIDLATLQAMNGGAAVPDGAHTVRITAVDDLGLTATRQFPMTLDRVGLVPGTPQLTADSDSGDSNFDRLTNVTTPKFNVAAEAGATVRLFAGDLLVATGPAGSTLQVQTPLAAGVYQMRAEITDLAGNVSGLSGAQSIEIRTAGAEVNLYMTPYTADLTPDARVWVDDPVVKAASEFWIDVDINGDGDFDDPGEMNHTSGKLYAQTGVLQQELPLATALPRNDAAPYLVNVRARLIDSVGNQGVSGISQLLVSTTTSNALEEYVNKDDGAYGWTVHDQFEVNNPSLLGGAFTVYVLDMTSQRWRNPEDFGEPTSDHPFAEDQTLWHHYLTIIVPKTIKNDSAMLLISGGSYWDDPYDSTDFNNPNGRVAVLGQQAALLGSVCVYLPVVPRENTRFADETITRTEDAIIAYSYDKFLDLPLGAESDWPLLMAMTKSAVKAMDATQEWAAANRPDLTIEDFVVTGGSKRGWTTWLTAAVDDRVSGIMPMVFDALNLGQQMEHHYGVYNAFSYAIDDYEEAQVFDRILTARGQELGKIVDPYAYLNNGRFEIPKLMINSAGDEFFVTDSAQYYIHDLPGTQNYLLYLANTGHGLDYDAGTNSKTVQALTTFYDAVVNDKPLPEFSWEVLDNGTLRVQTLTPPSQVVLWQGTNPVARDFRDATTNVTWTSSTLTSAGGGVYVATLPTPANGATGFFMELIFPSTFSVQGVSIPFRFTTQVVVLSNETLAPWPFPAELGGAAALPALGGAELAPLAAALPSANSSAVSTGASILVLPASAETPLAVAPASAIDAAIATRSTPGASAALPIESAASSSIRQTSFGSYDDAGDAELADLVLDEELDELLSVWG